MPQLKNGAFEVTTLMGNFVLEVERTEQRDGYRKWPKQQRSRRRRRFRCIR